MCNLSRAPILEADFFSVRKDRLDAAVVGVRDFLAHGDMVAGVAGLLDVLKCEWEGKVLANRHFQIIYR